MTWSRNRSPATFTFTKGLCFSSPNPSKIALRSAAPLPIRAASTRALSRFFKFGRIFSARRARLSSSRNSWLVTRSVYCVFVQPYCWSTSGTWTPYSTIVAARFLASFDNIAHRRLRDPLLLRIAALQIAQAFFTPFCLLTLFTHLCSFAGMLNS